MGVSYRTQSNTIITHIDAMSCHVCVAPIKALLAQGIFSFYTMNLISASSVELSEWYIERAPADGTPHDRAVGMSFLLVLRAFRNIFTRRERPSR